MQLSEELVSALELVRRSETIKVLVISGAAGTFCAGDDITEMGQWGNANQIMRRVRCYQQMADTLADLDKVTIAAVDGYAVGGGLEITMACDFVIATRRAKWGMPEVDVGITPGWGGTTRMTRLIGRRLAKEINLLGALHPASRAAQLGLWNRVVADDGLQKEVDALVHVLLSKNQRTPPLGDVPSRVDRDTCRLDARPPSAGQRAVEAPQRERDGDGEDQQAPQRHRDLRMIELPGARGGISLGQPSDGGDQS